MGKKFEGQLMKFEITNDKLKMEIKISDLVKLFENSPNNFGYDGEGCAKVRRGKRLEFVEHIVNQLMDESQQDENNTKWGQPFEDIFTDLSEDIKDEFIKYPNAEEY